MNMVWSVLKEINEKIAMILEVGNPKKPPMSGT
jgi:hypothetical protein